MRLSQNALDTVRDHLTETLPNVTEADPDTLGKYVMALLDRPAATLPQLKSTVASEMNDFLGDRAGAYVDNMFDLIQREMDRAPSSRNDKKRSRHPAEENHPNQRSRRMRRDPAIRPDEPYDPERMPVRHGPGPHPGYLPMPLGPPAPLHMRPPYPSASPPHHGMLPPMNGYPMGPPLPPPPHRRLPPQGPPSRAPRRNFRRNDAPPTNLFICNIPVPLNTLSKLSAHFGKFGEIVNVQLKPEENKAFLQFKTHEAAKRAISSPEAVCGNRFIRVMWAKYDPEDRSKHLSTATPSSEDEMLLKHEQEAKQRRERAALEKRLNQKRTLLQRLQMMAGVNEQREKQKQSLEEEIAQGEQELAKMPELEPLTPEDQQLDEELAKVEKQAAAIGIVDSAGKIVARGARAGVRGRGRGRGRAARMTLDLRSRAVLVKGIPGHLEHEKLLRSHFQTFGGIEQVQMAVEGPQTAVVQFQNRHSAEKALRYGSPILQQDVELEWYEGTIEAAVDGEENGQIANVIESNIETLQDEEVEDGAVSASDEDDEDNDRSWRR